MLGRACGLATVAAVAALVSAGAQAASAPRWVISTRVRPASLGRGASATIYGAVRSPQGPVVGELLELQARDSPGGRFRNIAHTLTLAGGHYRFTRVRPNRNMRYRVIDKAAAGRVGPVVEVIVELPAYPSLGRVLAAARYLAGRTAETGFAVVDSHGRVLGREQDRRFASASVVKSMMLVAYLQMLARQHRSLDRASQALLYPMIHASDNAAASAVLAIVGQQALDRVAREAGMRDYQRARGWWAFTQVSAADLARFFFRQDELIPGRFDAYARRLLSGIEASQSWGVPPIARPEFQVFFKTGWLPEEGVVDEAARLESSRITFAMAVLSVGEPSMAYGEQTIAGVTARLLGRAG
jgi:hypothetical protein